MDHPIYNLDKAIIEYIHPVLTAELGELFLRWDKELGEREREREALTRQAGLTAISDLPEKEIALQEDLLAGNIIRPAVSDAWSISCVRGV